MKAEIKGQKQLMADLERRLGPTVMKRKVDAAITAGAITINLDMFSNF